MHGLDAAAGPQSLCVSCGACATVCPVTIPLPQQILEVRRQVLEHAPSVRRSSLLTRIAMRAYASRTLFALGTRIAARVLAHAGVAAPASVPASRPATPPNLNLPPP